MVSIKIPQNLLPADGRFGSGPSLVPNEAVQKLAEVALMYMGNSHRKDHVRSLVGRLRDGVRTLFDLPDGWEVILGNGGATLMWDALSFCGIERQSQHLCFGAFSEKFARVVEHAPHLEAPQIISAELGSCPEPQPNEAVDFYALTHNETSTGVVADLNNPQLKNTQDLNIQDNALVAVDATSGAGAIAWDPAQLDIYYFSLQKGFAADGGLWVACCSPKAIQRFQKLTAERWCPDSLNLNLAYQNSIKNQTLNTPAVATLILAVYHTEWMLENGGLSWAAERSKTSSDILYEWAEGCKWANAFVAEPKHRSPVVVTIDLDEKISAEEMNAILRENGIYDTDSYRSLERNQLRFGVFPARDPADVTALTDCLNYIAEQL